MMSYHRMEYGASAWDFF